MKKLAGLLLISLVAFSGCSHDASARSGKVPAQALAIAPAAVRSPYEVTVVREDGTGVDTFAHKGRYYVLGAAGERYTIRVSNPTDQRVEAVVTVDGLDVIDGDDGDLGKRGYIVPPHGDLAIEGFRTATDQVATFRFSPIDASYAARKGKARNVGVIAVAIFGEQPAPAMVIDTPASTVRPDYRWENGASAPARDKGDGDDMARADRSAAAPTPSGASKAAGEASMDSRPSAGARAPMPPRDEWMPPPPPVTTTPPPAKTGRSGLGTEFGEQRYSATTMTAFVRAAGNPVAVAELRYNDAAGLTALGIAITPTPDTGELDTRETADPFPGSRFATPPR